MSADSGATGARGVGEVLEARATGHDKSHSATNMYADNNFFPKIRCPSHTDTGSVTRKTAIPRGDALRLPELDDE